MVMRPLRTIADTPQSKIAHAWLENIRERLSDANADRALICRETLCDLMYPAFSKNWETAVDDKALPLATRIALAALDPRNVTL